MLSDNPPAAGGTAPAEALLFDLEERHAQLCRELAVLERRLRDLRMAAEVCTQCGGTGQRWVRGGLYGELQPRPCGCRD